MIFLCEAANVITDERVTSEPVPAVVGIQIKGDTFVYAFLPAIYSSGLPPFGPNKAMAFAVSIGLPPPIAITADACTFLKSSAPVRHS